jgi:serine/threonine-protein kinase
MLQRADEGAMERAVELAAGLGSLDMCVDDGALASATPEDPEARRQVEVLGETSDRARALLAAAKYDEARELLGEAIETARALDHGPTTAQLLYQASRAELGLYSLDASRALGMEAWSIAEAAGDERRALVALIGLAQVIGYHQAQHREGLELLDVASGKLAHLGHLPRWHGELAYVRARLAQAQSRWREAAEAFAEARRVVSEAHGERSFEVGRVDNQLAVSYLQLGEQDAAEEYFESSLAIYEEVVGPDHPLVAPVVFNRGNLFFERGDFEAALDSYTKARDTRARAFGKSSYAAGSTLGNVAEALAALGRYEEAEEQLREALPIHAAELGKEHPAYTMLLSNLGAVLDMQGRHEEALPEHERAMAARERRLEAEHLDLGNGSASHGVCLHNLGRTAEAAAAFNRAVQIIERTSGSDTMWLVVPLWGLGVTELESGRRQSAVGYLQRALELNERTSHNRYDRARIQLALARALWPNDPEKARELAEQARPTYDALHYAKDNPNVIDAWLRKHGGRKRAAQAR